MGKLENTPNHYELESQLESLMEPPSYEEGSSIPQVHASSTDQKQKFMVKFLLCDKFKVTTYKSEFWMAPSTTLQEACDIANRKLVRDMSASDRNGVRKLVRSIGEWMAVGTSQNHCDVIFVRPRVLAGDVHQTIGETILGGNWLYLSNSIDCFNVKARYLFFVISGLILLGTALLFLILISMYRSFAG